MTSSRTWSVSESTLAPGEIQGNPEATSPARGGLFLIGALLAISIVNYLFSVALAWILPQAVFGLVGVIQGVLTLSATTLDSGFPWTLALALSRVEELGTRHVRAVFRSSIVGNLAIAGTVGAGILIAGQLGFLGVQIGLSAMVIVVLTLPFFALNSVARGALNGQFRFGQLSFIKAGEVVVKAVVGLALVAGTGAGVAGVAGAFFAGAIWASLTAAWFLRHASPGRGALAPIREFRGTAPMFIGTFGVTVLVTLDTLGLYVLGGATAAGATMVALYQVGAMLARLPYFAGNAIMDAAYPFIARRSGSAERSHGYMVAAIRWIGLIVLPIVGALLISPSPVLGLFFPASYGAAVTIVRIIAVGTIGAVGTAVFGRGLQALGRAGNTAVAVVAGLVVESTLLVLLVPRSNVVGAAVAFTAGTWTSAIIAALSYQRVQAVRLRLSPFPRSWAAALLAGLPAFVIAGFLRPVAGVGLMVVGTACYFVALLAFHVLTPDESDRLGRMASRMANLAARVAARPARILDHPRLVVGVAIAVALVILGYRLTSSPDTIYDEAVYTQAAMNVATTGHLTWNGPPVFIHPPLYFLVQGAWLAINGVGPSTGIFTAIYLARELTIAAGAINVGLTMTLGYLLAPPMSTRRRSLIAIAIGAIAVVDPVLMRYSRLATLESMALCAGLVFLVAAVKWGPPTTIRSGWRFGLLCGIALLFKELTVFLLLAMLLWAALLRSRRAVAASLLALGIGVAIWLTFPLWSLMLGLAPSFAQQKFLTFERLLGILQVTGWNRPNVSFIQALLISAPQYVSSYLLLALGGVALIESWLHRSERNGLFLTAWLATTYLFGAYTVAAGQLNEQFFTYLMPGAIVGTVLGGERLIAWVARRSREGAVGPAKPELRWPEPIWQEPFVREPAWAVVTKPGAKAPGTTATVVSPPASAPPRATQPVSAPSARSTGLRRALLSRTAIARVAVGAMIALVVGAGGVTWWRLYAVGDDAGMRGLLSYVQATLPTCTAVNTSGTAEPYLLGPTGHEVTAIASGPRAATLGVHYFVVDPKDVWARYGPMTSDLADWIHAHGQLVATFPSLTYWNVELWRVGTNPFDPAVDIQGIPGGAFVNTLGAACGGFTVTDSSLGRFATAYAALGGKAVVGPPISQVWVQGGIAYQAFDTLVLAAPVAVASSGSLPPRVAMATPAALVPQLAASAAAAWKAADLPVPQVTSPKTWTEARALLTDPVIAQAYLGVAVRAARASDWLAAMSRWGDPLGSPSQAADGSVRQAFESVIWEHGPGASTASLAVLGPAITVAQIIPATAAIPEPGPVLVAPFQQQPSAVYGFVIAFVVGVMAWLIIERLLGVRSLKPRSRASLSKSALVDPEWQR